ncbi:hypothetical protein Cme02nite_45130 [Catellatospora methionotrophica]|uniref:Uncharacterized protein n=1 Tax=Catellatospora methionotrophica TaxID=121620 RepID=A0A8J3PIA1_9ACTN|nr:hypothetical protein [Catellatospora methionotrophica]GIG16181.1 hypothetical protein Cme02nite_45130 [Catellatospora methionotrophica]
MATRTVSVRLSLEAHAYLRQARDVQRATRDIRDEAQRLQEAGAAMSRGGFSTMLAGVPGVASAAAAGLGLLPAAALSGFAAMTTLMAATNGVGEALSAVADDDAALLVKALDGLTEEAQAFVREFQRVGPALGAVGDASQSALFSQLEGDLTRLTSVYIPTLLRQMPQLAAATARVGTDFTAWATAPKTVSQVSGQLRLAVDVVDDLSRLLRSGAGAMLDLADAGKDFTRDTVDGLADGAEAFERWVGTARSTGQLNQIFDNGGRILQRLGEIAGRAGLLLADIVDNPALVDGAEALFDVLHIGLDVVHGLLLAFEALPTGVQSAVVTFAVFGGAALMVTGRVIMLKGALDAMKVSAVQAGTAAKGVAAMFGGPWGLALTAAATAVTVLAMSEADARQRVQALAESLDQQTGAVTENTRAVIAAELQGRGLLKHFADLGVGSDVVVDAILGNAAAMNTLNDALLRNQTEVTHIGPAYAQQGKSTKEVRDFLAEYGVELDEATAGNALQRQAVQGSTNAIRGQISAVKALGEELRAQTDPAFALLKAQKDLKAAQAGYNEAVREHGRNSPEAKAASLALAEASVTLAGAVSTASEKFNGQLTPQLYAALRAAGLTEKQIDDVEEAFMAAAKAGGEFAGTYTAKVHADTAQADAALQATIAKTLLLKDKSIRISASVYWTSSGDLHVPGGTLIRRWGGITEHAQTGLLRDAAIYSPVAAGARYAFAEPATGGEAFIPKYGDHDRNMAILSEAARWNRASVVPWENGGGGGGGNSYSTAYNIYPQQANFGVNELRAVQAARDAYDRVGRPR